jgi:hypothetical protein
VITAHLQNLVAGKQIPPLADFGLDEVVQRIGRDEVDEGITDLTGQLRGTRG